MLRPSLFAAALCAALIAAAPGKAADVKAGDLQISAAWSRATPKGAKIGGGYLKIINTGSSADRLVGGTTGAADKFELHEMSMDNGVMKMRPLAAGLEIKPGATIELKPGGYHVMFVGLHEPLVQGQRLKATLQFEKAGKVEVEFSVEGIGAPGSGHTKH